MVAGTPPLLLPQHVPTVGPHLLWGTGFEPAWPRSPHTPPTRVAPESGSLFPPIWIFEVPREAAGPHVVGYVTQTVFGEPLPARAVPPQEPMHALLSVPRAHDVENEPKRLRAPRLELGDAGLHVPAPAYLDGARDTTLHEVEIVRFGWGTGRHNSPSIRGERGTSPPSL